MFKGVSNDIRRGRKDNVVWSSEFGVSLHTHVHMVSSILLSVCHQRYHPHHVDAMTANNDKFIHARCVTAPYPERKIPCRLSQSPSSWSDRSINTHVFLCSGRPTL
ncbi:unnamed protein product, partial [Ectocarpus sp. 12 AP-2014]